MTVEDRQGRTVTAPTFDMDRDDARWADQEKGHMGVLTEKRRGAFGSGAYALNPHTNRYGFVRPHIAGQVEDVPVSLQRRSHFDLGHGR